MNILLTGGSGFIGKNIIEALSNKYKIYAPRHKELDLLSEDAVREFFVENEIDIVIHSAVKPGHRNAIDTNNLLDSNTRMFFNLARNSSFFKKMIFLSSGATYDVSRDLNKVTESSFDNYVPHDEHGFSKYVCSKYLENANNIIDLRIFGVFGKYEDYSIRFISNVICKAMFDLPITIKQNRAFDYIYIDDFISILEYFILNDSKHKSYNITPDNSIQLFEIAEKVLQIMNKKLSISISATGIGKQYSGDNKRLHDEISDLKFNTIDDSIRDLVGWYEINKETINKELLLNDK